MELGFSGEFICFEVGFFPHHIFKPRYFHISWPGGCFTKSNHWLEFLNSTWKSKKPGEPPSSLLCLLALLLQLSPNPGVSPLPLELLLLHHQIALAP